MTNSLRDLHALVTSGPTYEPIDPVRFLGNRSSGKQGHAIAAALHAAGAKVTLVSGPVAIATPEGVNMVSVQTAEEMLQACENALPADIAVCVAAVADWRVKTPSHYKLKKGGGGTPVLELVENPDILKALAQRESERPQLVVGFAAESSDVFMNASAKRLRKRCDWIVANDVSNGGSFGKEENEVMLITDAGHERWPSMSKLDVAAKLVQKIEAYFITQKEKENT